MRSLTVVSRSMIAARCSAVRLSLSRTSRNSRWPVVLSPKSKGKRKRIANRAATNQRPGAGDDGELLVVPHGFGNVDKHACNVVADGLVVEGLGTQVGRVGAVAVAAFPKEARPARAFQLPDACA